MVLACWEGAGLPAIPADQGGTPVHLLRGFVASVNGRCSAHSC